LTSVFGIIVRERPSGLRLFLVLRGPVLQRIPRTLLFNILLATLMHGNLRTLTLTLTLKITLKITLTAIPFSLIGLPLAIFLGFATPLPTTATGKPESCGARSCSAPILCRGNARA
jgi:predicted membrane chloride channel (bestrophin family)